ncbi:phage tail spike protein [Enterococcus sp. LJL99]
MMKSVYFFDERQQLICIVKEAELVEVIQEKEITSNKEELMKDTLTVSTVYNQELRNAFYMAVKESKQFYSVYRIINDNEKEDVLSFTGISFAADELDAYVVERVEVTNSTPKETLQKLLNGTEWQIDTTASNLPLITEKFEFVSIKEALKIIQSYGCELTFKYKLDGIGITKKQIDIHKEIGTQSNRRFTYGEKALSIVKEQDRTQIYTSLIGRGRGEEVGDGEGKRVDFSAIEWRKSQGDPLDKPKGQQWLEYPEMTKQYGLPLKNGVMRKREQVMIFDEEENAATLLQKTYEALVECSRPLTQFKTEVLTGDSIGNTVTIHRHDRHYHYQTRIFKVKINRLTENVEAGLGDNITRNISKATSDIQGNLNTLEEKKMTFYDTEEISKWQDDVLRGAGENGGSVYQVNGIEAGISDSREVYETIYMNGSNIANSTHFMIQNNEGISFKKCAKKGEWRSVKDVHQADSKTAWKVDGTFNADFITAGTIKGRDIEGCVFRTLANSFQIKIFDGQIIFSDKKQSKELGGIIATYGGGKVNGFAVIQKPGFIFSLNSESKEDGGTSKYVIQIPSESSMDEPKINSRGVWRHGGDLHITGRLFLNGREITSNGSGGNGGTGGGYPAELTTDQEKNAWFIWQYFKNKGWTEEAIAGMLGNMQSESQIIPDMDELSGGGGYGLVQWTPKSKLVDWCNEQGIDYRTLDSQCQRIQFEVNNNIQWFYNYDRPDIAYISFKEFTKLKDINHAAECFIALYEHPGDPYQPNRAIQARYWYDKLHNLKAGSSGTKGLAHLESLVGQWLGNGECYAVSAEYSGYLGGCGLGAGTAYGLSHVIGNTDAAADIGSSYNWSAVGWKVIVNPTFNQLVVGAIINWKRGGNIAGFSADYSYGHTGVIRGLTNTGFQTYEQNAGLGKIVGKYDRPWIGANEISSIIIPPK